jgi:hypothetical protein
MKPKAKAEAKSEVKVDIGANETFTRSDLEFMIKDVEFYSDTNQSVKCVRLLKQAVAKLGK